MTTFAPSDRPGELLVRVGDGEPVARYVYEPDVPAVETPKPYLHPVRTLAGATVTDLQPEDHPWHHGLFAGMPRVGDHNLWGGGTYLGPDRGYEVLADQGRVEHVAFPEGTAGDTLVEQLRWLGHGGEELLVERRTIAARAAGAGWCLDLGTRLTAVPGATDGTLALETPAQRGRPDGGYGGLWLRLAAGLTVAEVHGQDGLMRASGVESDWLVARCRTAGAEEVTLGLGQGAGWPADRRHWVLRLDDFPALGWAPAYRDGLALAPGAELELGHRLVVLDGWPDVAEVAGLVQGAA